MKWTPGGESQDIEDRRDEGDSGGGGFHSAECTSGLAAGCSACPEPFIQQNFFALLGGGGPGATHVASQPNPAKDAAEKPLVQFVSFVLDDTQHNWEQILPEQSGRQYRHAKLVLFRNYTQSGCGSAESATGPFIVLRTRESISTLDFMTS